MEFKCVFYKQDDCVGPTSIYPYICYVNKSQNIAQGTIIQAFDGIHKDGKSNQDVEAIQFSGCMSMQYLPRGVHMIFPHLRSLSVGCCEILELSRADLSGLETLESLYFGSTGLKSLPSDLLVGMNKLKRVSFRGNQIECLSSEILKPIINNEVTSIDFSYNKSINAFYAPGERGSVASMEELMKIIDTQCTKPKEAPFENVYEDSSIEAFNATTARAVCDLWNSKDLSDFKIIAGEKEFPVHKFVLAAHSLKFAAMFKDKEKEVNEMNIKDLGVEVVEAFLRYLYTGKVKDDVDASELFALSSKLEVPVLKSICKKMVIDSLQETNALKILNLGHAYDCDELKKKAFDEIRRSLPDVNLSDNMMEKLEDLKKLIEAKQFYELMKEKFMEM